MIEEAILQTCANLQENRNNDCGRNVILGAGMLFWRQQCYFSGRNVILGVRNVILRQECYLGAGMLFWGQECYCRCRNVILGAGTLF